MRRAFIAGNWKMYKTPSEAKAFARELKSALADVRDRDILVGVSFVNIAGVVEELRGSNIWVAAQNMYYEKEGAFTGEVSPVQLKDAGVTHVILGHSERRHIFGETDEMINKKVRAALDHGLLPILCIGELLEEREKGETEAVCKRQVVEAYKGLSKEEALKVTIAYEPVWAIGTGKTATPEDANQVHAFVRKVLADLYDKEVADKTRIQYGGSVKPENIDALMAQEHIDGALVGGASLKLDSFARIVRFQA